MEEDIIFLDEWLDKEDRKFVSEYRLMFLQHIENLIIGAKQLEKENKELKEANDILARRYATREEVEELKETIACLHESSKDYIPKSKIEDKIKELEDNIPYLAKFSDWESKDYTNHELIELFRDNYKELLEG